MRKPLWSLLLLAIAAAAQGSQAPTPGVPAPKRINRAIDLLSQGQPVYYTTSTGGYR